MCSNKKIANATEAAAVASLEGAKYILEAEKYKLKLFQTENHKDDEITYLLSKYTQLLDLADISAAKAGTAYGVIKHVRNVARLNQEQQETPELPKQKVTSAEVCCKILSSVDQQTHQRFSCTAKWVCG